MTGLELTLLVALAAALVLGAIAHRLGAPPMLGYIVAGLAVGPATPGPEVSREDVLALAAVGRREDPGRHPGPGGADDGGRDRDRPRDGLAAHRGPLRRRRRCRLLDRRPLQGGRRGNLAYDALWPHGAGGVGRAGPAHRRPGRHALGPRIPRGGDDRCSPPAGRHRGWFRR